MVFRKAVKNEAKNIVFLYKSVIGMPFCTWDETYPGEEEIKDDLSSETLYILEDDGELIGAISIVPENELDAFNCWKIKDNAREFARVVIRPVHQNKGWSRHLIEGILHEFHMQDVAAVHIAVAKQNTPARKLYSKMGFVICGEADMYGNSFFLCEKIL